MSKLSKIIERKINESILNPGKATTTLELPSGLNFRLRKDADKITIYLSISGKKPPSEIEIKTFIDHWPQETPRPEDFTAGVVFKIYAR